MFGVGSATNLDTTRSCAPRVMSCIMAITWNVPNLEEAMTNFQARQNSGRGIEWVKEVGAYERGCGQAI